MSSHENLSGGAGATLRITAMMVSIQKKIGYFTKLDSADDFRSGCRNVSIQQQFFSESSLPGRSHHASNRIFV